MKDFENCKETIEKFDKTRREIKTKEEQLETALYDWLNKTEEFETAVCQLLDGEIKKRAFNKVKVDLEIKYKVLHDFIKSY